MADSFKDLKATRIFQLLSERQARFKDGKAEMPEYEDNATVIAKALHPKRQYLEVAEVKVLSED